MTSELLFSKAALELGYGLAALVALGTVVWSLLYTLDSLMASSRRRVLRHLDVLGRPRV